MQKIKSITLRNFKYFYGVETEQPQNKIELDSNNLLLYGENGSGKSSLYWAIYTFLQSAIKEPTSEIEKYFEPTNPQNLRNRFAHEDAESGIMIQFEAPTGGTLKEIKRNTNKTYSINTFQDTFITRALVGSDFINYKFLSKIYDFRNSEVINLFEMFDREIFMFVDFEEAFTFHDGTLSTKTYASDWWKFISEAYRTLPYNGNIVSVGSVEYKRFKNVTIPRFIELLKKFLLEITQGTNEYLENEFKEKISISFDIDNVKCDFNKNISQRAKDGKLHKPKIPLIVKLNHDKLGENKSSLHKPHTFLNEASLTAIALAIRLSILDRRPTFPDSARILILDDLLLSLDMSHRDKVLDIFLSEAFINTYQILILTHDRSFYNMCKNRIQDRFDKGWLFKEMYQHQTDAGVPCPFMPKKESHLDMAIKYLKEFDYPASANYLRKEAERVLCYLLPKHLTFFDKLDEGSSILNLEGLISRFEVYYKALGGNYAPFKKLKEHKDLLLNPLSHDNIESPIYKRELDSTIDILKNLNKLKVHTFGLPDENDAMKFELHETDIDSDNWVFEFTLKETLRAIKSLNGQWLLSNPSVNFLSRENKTKNLPKEALKSQVKLSQGYGNIR
ncbi:MAG: ATP-binding protein, partial [Bacteroidetes bacterium]|nr:ATP-binding protein [Bacteroidota bacterium]